MVAIKCSPRVTCFLLLQATALVSAQVATPTASSQSTEYSFLGPVETLIESIERSASQAATTVLSGVTAASATASSAAQTYTISVGIDHKYRPDVIQASAGDSVEFRFYPRNHSVVRAEYMFPCIPYEMTGRGKVGFYSGWEATEAILDDPPTWNLLINDTDPIFFYCSVPGSCDDYGMVGVINPNRTTSLETQRGLALQAAYVLNPGDPFPAEASSSIASLGYGYPTVTPGSSPTGATTSPTAAASTGGTKLGTGAIVGIAIGGAVILLLAAALFYFFGRSRSLKQQLNRDSATVPTSTSHQFASPPMSPAPHHSPDMYQSGGAVFVPVHPKDYRGSTISNPYDVPPYSEDPMRAASPRSELGGYSHPGPGSPQGPQEMYAPFPQQGKASM
ncbi:hypothetical protein W97_07375 [Coniosporium apollinis CBS 100218]|uniref:Extracellular serine-rich protein n=1 Tax=Coniosporium apollinis (strain CBS 100218) TaxID=1168221 RepID=R7Z1A9_CONA1|nr:uncharacterized protein W97_07375 [Coniosporium apollinis CBS 100218]EON67878.1 hypothetical protein W97_07375 [Coniosporium apollinis CBS 100218]